MKKNVSLFWLSIVSIFSLSAFVIADDPFATLLKKLEDFTKKYPTEKVHLHIDKPYYAIGDDIWFKAYVIDGKTTEPTTLSNILYVELINEKDSVAKQLKIAMKSGIAWGDFKLTETLEEGNYRLRAYTQWMRNAGPNFFFEKMIKVGNGWTNNVFTNTSFKSLKEGKGERLNTSIIFSDKIGKPYVNNPVNFETFIGGKSVAKGMVMTTSTGEARLSILNPQPEINKTGLIIATLTLADGTKTSKNIPLKTIATDPDVQFFPEGGSSVDELPGKIAIKVVNAQGRGENISGKIVDNDGTEILDFETTYLGMGSFSLTAVPGKSYSARVKFADGSTKSINLPKSQPSGYAIAVNNIDSSKITVKVMLSSDLLNKGELNLLAHKNGTALFTAKVPTSKQLTTITIQKGDLPSGLISITLFSPENLPIAERIAFVNNTNDKIALNIEGLKVSYGKKQNFVMDMFATNVEKPTQGSFSVSVTNSTVVNPDPENETNLLTSLLLTSDLKGYVEKPNHYFMNNDLNTRIELDHLLLTQGWRKLDWKEIHNPLSTSTYPAEKSMNISGTLTTNGKNPVADGKITLLSTSKGMVMANTVTDKDGHFSFDDVSFGDSIKFVLKGTTNAGKTGVRINLDKFPEQTIAYNKNLGDIEVNVNASMLKYLIESNDYFDDQYKNGFLNKTNQLKTVNIVQKKKKEDSAAVNSTNLNGRGRANAVITAKDLENTTDLAQFLRSGRVPGVTVRSNPEFNNIPMLTRPRTPPQSDSPDDPDQPYMAISLDGMMIQKFSADLIAVQDIESIEVLTDMALTAVYGSEGYYGILIITTKLGKGRKIADINAPGITIFTPKGYDVGRQFYSPKYDATPNTTPDFRSTVYWNPHLVTDASGKANINFFNTGEAGTYRILIEGIDAFGNLARKLLTYEVK